MLYAVRIDCPEGPIYHAFEACKETAKAIRDRLARDPLVAQSVVRVEPVAEPERHEGYRHHQAFVEPGPRGHDEDEWTLR
jgi:hypothetical protein